VIVGFVDICGIVDHHCLNFLFIITSYLKSLNTKEKHDIWHQKSKS